MNKKELYRRIMESISVLVKKALEQSDSQIEKDFIKWYNSEISNNDKNIFLDTIIETCKKIKNGLLNPNDLKEGECYNTGMNTPGMGEVIPAGINSLGSGDRFDLPAANMATKKSKKKK